MKCSLSALAASLLFLSSVTNANLIQLPQPAHPIHSIAQLSHWVSMNGPQDGFGYQLRQSSGDVNTLFVFRQNNQFYRSQDGGVTWKAIASPDKADIKDMLSPTANKLFMTTEKGLYLSTDRGTTWNLIKKGPNPFGVLFSIYPTTLFLISNWGEFYYSNDSGLNWSLTEVEPEWWLSSAIGRDNVVAIGSSALSVSSDGGLTFKNRNPNPDYGVFDLAINSQHEIFVTDRYYLHKTNPDLSSWENVVVPSSPQNILIDAKDNIYVTNSKTQANAILKSTDNGKSWQQLFQTKVIRNLNMLDDGKIILSTDQGLMMSDIKQEKFTVLNNAFKGLDVNKMYASDQNHLFEILDYGNAIPAMLYRSDDGGKTWEKSFSKDEYGPYDVVQFKDQWVLTTGHTIYSSSDAGKNWQLMATLPENSLITELTVCGDNIIGSGYKDLYISTDLTHWKLLFAGTSSYPYDSAYSINNTFFVATKTNVMASTDGGQTWKTSLDKVNSTTHKLSGYQDKVMLAIYEMSGIYKTTDAGSTWTKISTAINGPIEDVVLIDEKTYAALTKDHIYLTQDGGTSWTLLEKGIKNQNIKNLYASKDYLFAKSEYNGIYQAI